MDLQDSYYITKLKETEPQHYMQIKSIGKDYITKLKETEPQLFVFDKIPFVIISQN